MTVKFDIINESRISEYKHSPSVTQYKLVVGGVKGVDLDPPDAGACGERSGAGAPGCVSLLSV